MPVMRAKTAVIPITSALRPKALTNAKPMLVTATSAAIPSGCLSVRLAKSEIKELESSAAAKARAFLGNGPG